MSRLGKKPIDIPKGVKVAQTGGSLKVTGSLGTVEMSLHPGVKVKVDESAGKVVVENDHPNNRRDRQMHGTTRALIANMITGVSKGFERKLEIYGTGYSVKEQTGKLMLQVGLASPVQKAIPKGIAVKIDAAATRGDDVPAKFTLSAIDKCLLGQFASEVRKIRPPEPYKGKGIRYADEHIKRKVGKAFASGPT